MRRLVVSSLGDYHVGAVGPDLRGGLRVIPPAEDVLPRSQAGGDQHIVDDLKVVRAI